MGPKLAIVMSGGGMRCAYALGVLSWVTKQLDGIKPDLVIGGSGSSGIAAYLASGQLKDINHIWRNHVPTQRFINPRRLRHVVDLDYLASVVRETIPLDLRSLKRSKTRCLIAALNYETGRVRYFSNRRPQDDILLGLRASVAAPFITNSPVVINGKRYGDSFLSTTAKLHAIKAEAVGSTHIIMIDCSSNEFLTQRMHDLWLHRRTAAFRARYRKYMQAIRRHVFPDGLRMATLRPHGPAKAGFLDTNIEHIKAAIRQGERDAARHLELKTLLRDFKRRRRWIGRLLSISAMIPNLWPTGFSKLNRTNTRGIGL